MHPTYAHVCFAVRDAKDLLLTCLGEPEYKGVIWLWTGERIGSRHAVQELAGNGWWVVEYPDLPGAPKSLVTHELFLESFSVEYNPLKEKLSFRLDRERYIDGKLCTFTGECRQWLYQGTGTANADCH
jgi:hypothetical protein